MNYRSYLQLKIGDKHFPLLHTASKLHRVDAYEAVKIF